MNETKARFKIPDMYKNPFYANLKKIGDEIYIISIDPIYPPFYMAGFLGIMLAFAFTGFSLWLIPGVAISSLGFFWATPFYYIFLRLGLRKKGYKGKVELIRNNDILRIFINNII